MCDVRSCHRGPNAGKALFFKDDEKGEEADLAFGAVTVLTGGGVMELRI